jgi:indolepyruvate ferredoxin oxidoreductase
VAVDKNVLAFNWGRFVAQNGAGDLLKSTQHAVIVKMPESLENVIATREALLAAYQSEAYARSYRDVVERIREKEKLLNAKLPLTRAVAVNLAKLMAYKDEYEVARLYADPAYLDKLREQFEGEPGRDYKLMFHLAPPLFAKRDERGHLVKQRFGAWMLPAFRVLAKMKGLRGTSFDVFGKTEERRTERRMIADYIALVDEFVATLDAQRCDAALKLAQLPDEIRGFGHVKERNIAAVAKKRERLIESYRAPVEVAATA